MTRRRTQRCKNTKKRSHHKKRARKTRVRTIRKQRGDKQRGDKQRGDKQRGGTCYGSGVGRTSTENNFSVFNTNQLKLFPYKP